MTKPKTILLVDDSLVTAAQLQQIIAGFEDYQVIGHADNGAEAVKLYKELLPDIVCMDIVMPVMDGLKATQSILQVNPAAKIVVISSLGGTRETVITALRLGAKNVIAKPFEEAAIRQILDSLG